MTTSERSALRRDLQNPADLFTLVAENNPEGLSNQFQAWGFTYGSSSPSEMVGELMKMWNAGGEMQEKALRLVGGVQYRYNVLPAWMDEVITGNTAPQLRSTTGTAEDQTWYSEMDWGGIIDSIFGGIAQFTGGQEDNGNVGTSPVDPYQPGTNTAQNGQMVQWIAIGAAVLVIIVALFIAMRK